MSTPALDRATEALVELDGRLELLYPEHLDDETVSAVSATIVSAALHDPDDPDWRAKVLYAAWPYHDGPIDAPPDDWDDDLTDMDREPYRLMADALSAAILGEAS